MPIPMYVQYIGCIRRELRDEFYPSVPVRKLYIRKSFLQLFFIIEFSLESSMQSSLFHCSKKSVYMYFTYEYLLYYLHGDYAYGKPGAKGKNS